MRLRAIVTIIACIIVFPGSGAGQQRPLKLFISVDMEGIGGIGTPQMTSASGKDYALGRQLMTAEVNAVIDAILERGPAEILVNDSHGDMQNLLHTELDPRVTYIQGAVKPYGMMEGLDATYDGVMFIGYHARAGTAVGFLAHTGSGAVKGLWIDGRESGEGDMNAAYAAALGVPVLLVSGDSAVIEQLSYLNAASVTTKVAVTPQSAALRHPELVRERLAAAARSAAERARTAGSADGDDSAAPRAGSTNASGDDHPGAPVRVRLRFADVTSPQILEAIPGVRQVDGYTVEFEADDMSIAYRLIRLMYRFLSI
ncbi:MAG TPA: M55 family metallopeptidase [Longimicrobiales bacterium]